MIPNNNGARGQQNIRPNLQPKPLVSSTIGPSLQNVISQPLMPRLVSQGNLVQSVRQNQFVIGTAHGLSNAQQRLSAPLSMGQPRMATINLAQSRFAPISVSQACMAPISVSQPCMTSHMIQAQPPRRAVYVQPGQTNVSPIGQLNIPKLVAGVPVYQNSVPFQQGSVALQQGQLAAAQALVKPVSSANIALKPGRGTQIQPHMALAFPTGSRQLQQLGTSTVQQAQLVHGAPGQLVYRPSVQNQGYQGIHVQGLQAINGNQIAAGIQAAASIHTTGGIQTSGGIQTGDGIQAMSGIHSTGGLQTSGGIHLASGIQTSSGILAMSGIQTNVITPGAVSFQTSSVNKTSGGIQTSTGSQTIRTTGSANTSPALAVHPHSVGSSPQSALLKVPSLTRLSTATPGNQTEDTTQSREESKSPGAASPPVRSDETFRESVLNLRQNTDGKRATTIEATSTMSHSTQKPTSLDPETSLYKTDMYGEHLAMQEEFETGHDDLPDDKVEEDPEFVWEEYLQDIGASAVPPTAFKHVEYSLQSGFVKGMKLEVRNKSDPSTYWVASVLMTCGPLLRLRYDGYQEDSSADFWCDLATSEVHSIGWCAQNGENLQPPEEIRDKFQDWRQFLMESLTGARTAPSYLLDKETGITPIDQLKRGMRLELQDALNPLSVWFVQIIENVGGRLYLRLEGTESASKHFWMFYLNHCLHQVGWASPEEGYYYWPPNAIADEHSPEEWEEIRETALRESENLVPPADVFKDQTEINSHKFEVGMKLEALHPDHNQIGPATVVKVINEKYFLVQIDDQRHEGEREALQICCHSAYLSIFPVGWCQCKGIRLTPPLGWKEGDFVWGEYLAYCNAKAAPEKLFTAGTEDHEFERGMKLEAVNPSNENQVCAATITKIVGPLLWVHLDTFNNIPSHIEDIDSHNLFPIGWCESNGFQLKPPRKTQFDKKAQHRLSKLANNLPAEVSNPDRLSHLRHGSEGGCWCPAIYFNHRCFSGPYLSKGRIAELPKSVGPGPMGLVLKEVLSLLINVAYKSCRVLKEIQLEGPPNPSLQQHLLKAKYKGKTYRAVVEVCRKGTQLEEFCRQICIKLECCPYLFSPLYVDDICPENCQQLTKTKYNYNYGKKKKRPVGRPPLHHPKVENGVKLLAKRGRKKKRFHLIHKKSHSHAQNQALYDRNSNRNGEMSKDEGFIDYDKSMDEGDSIEDAGVITPSKKRKYTHHLPPPSDIQTRGAKLPKYSFERKTHKKILLPQTGPVLKTKEKLKSSSVGKYEAVRQEFTLVPREESLQLESNPLHWTVANVVMFIKNTDCAHLARIIKEQEIDGQALLLLNLSTIQEHLELKLGPAVKLCHQIERLKVAFYESFA